MRFREWLLIENAGPQCPNCGKPMMLRQNRATGEQFYGCSGYPRCKGTRPGPSQTPKPAQPQAQQQQQQLPFKQSPPTAATPTADQKRWYYAKVTKKGDPRFNIGQELAMSKVDGPTEEWEYFVLNNREQKGKLTAEEARMGTVQSLRNIKNNKVLGSFNPSVEDLEQQLSQIYSGNEEQPTAAAAAPEKGKENKRTIDGKMISPEQKKIDERFAQVANSKDQEHIMISALAGTGKTTMLKHLAWKYGKPGQKWLYIVFNTRNKVEASESFPPWVDVRTSNGFLGEVLKSRDNISRIGQTDRIVDLQKLRKPGEEDEKGRLEKSRLIADTHEFANVMEKLGIPRNYNTFEYPKNMNKTLLSILKGIQYNFKESVLQMLGLAKSFSVDPRNDQGAEKGLDDILQSYDIDIDLSDIKERVGKYEGNFGATLREYLNEILGYDFMQKNYTNEIKSATNWMLRELMPNASKANYIKGKIPAKLAGYRDFDDDLWYAATHADQLIWPKYNYVLADEVQDFNSNQKIMLKKLAEAGAKIVAVGDKNQSLYRFRGADANAFDNIGDMLSGMSKGDGQVVHGLTNNYRSRPEILDFANQETHVKDLKSGRQWSDDQKGDVTKFDIKYDDTLGNLSQEFQQGGKIKKETAFIARTNAPLVKTALQLLSKKIPFIIVGKDVANDLIKHIRATVNKNGLRDESPVDELSYQLSSTLDKEKSRYAGKSSKKEHLQEITDITEALMSCISSFESESQNDQENQLSIGQFKQWIGTRFGGLDVEENEKDLQKYKQMIDQVNPVILTTAHKSKGLEFSRVFILRYDQFPHPKAKRDQDLAQEENGKYVALTRAKDELHILDLEGQPGYKSTKEK